MAKQDIIKRLNSSEQRECHTCCREASVQIIIAGTAIWLEAHRRCDLHIGCANLCGGLGIIAATLRSALPIFDAIPPCIQKGNYIQNLYIK